MVKLTREPPAEVRNLLIKLIDVSKNDNPGHVLDASINHLGMNLAVIAKLQGRSRGELKRMARTAFGDALEMALGNFDQTHVPGEYGTN